MQQAVRNVRDGPSSGRGDEGRQPAGIEHAQADDDRAYLRRKPSYSREQFAQVREMLGQAAVGIAACQRLGLARRPFTGSRRPAGAEAAFAA
jgi:putative DNA-invertase from lambdoid prophage Rac